MRKSRNARTRAGRWPPCPTSSPAVYRRRIRIRLSNEYGSQPLVVGAVRVAGAGEAASIEPGSERTVTFGGNRSAIVPPGAPLLSDLVGLAVPDLAQIAVNIFLPAPTPMTTFYWDARQTGWIVSGNLMGSNGWPASTATSSDSPARTS